MFGEFGRNLANRSNQFAATVNHRFEFQKAASVTVCTMLARNHCSPRDKDDATGNLFHTAASISVRSIFAGIAQLVEQLICNQQVVGSNPTAGSSFFHKDRAKKSVRR